jgi:hypothetical protein
LRSEASIHAIAMLIVRLFMANPNGWQTQMARRVRMSDPPSSARKVRRRGGSIRPFQTAREDCS